MLDTQGRLTGAVGAFIDVTQRKGAEKALAERARLLDLSNDAILVRDARDRIVYWNAGAEEAYGYTKEEALGRAPVELLRTVYPQPVENIMESLQRDGRWTGELGHTRKDGEQITVATRWALNRGEQNNTAILEINSDITEGKRAEQSLRESEALYRAIARNFPDGAVYVFDHDLRFLVADGKAMAALGYSRESLEGKTIWEAVDEETRRIIHQRYLRVLAGESLHYETRLRGRVFNSAYVPIRNDRQAVIAGMVVSHDITERKAAEDSLRQARDELEKRVCERTAELQTRAAQLARLTSELTMAEQRERQHLARVLHDGLQQLLVAAKFRLNVLESAADEHVRQEARELNELLSDSIETSRSLTAELSPSVLKSGLVPSLEWLARWMEEKHGLEVVLEVQGGTLPLDENLTVLLFQSVRELLFNVVKHAGVRNARIHVTPTDSSVQIVVSDEGAGFDTIRRLDDNQTGGFGLFAIRERLDLLGGCLQIDSAPGRGSRFTLRTPLSEPQADAAQSRQPLKVSLSITAPAEPTASDGEGRVRIALVDDHAVIRHGLAAVLRQEKRFYVIGEASDGKSAVELVRRLQPDVVLMDISMPGMNGIEATGIIHQEFPHVCVIGLSMHDDPHASQQMRQAGAVAYLSKSGPASDIVQAILSCLAGPDPP
jgi:PAS domain S-box-containing protein